jgi:hypothetical protein
VEEAQFVATGQETTWWLMEPASEVTLEATKRLGEAFGWGEMWYQDPGRVPTQLKEIWDFIQRQTQVTQLWDALATAVAIGDPYKRADWLNSVADLKQPKAKAGAPPSESTGAGAGTQVSTPGAGGTPPAAPPVAKKASAFGARAKAAQDTAGPPAGATEGQTGAGTAAADTPSATATPSAPPTEARKPSAFAKKGAATADSTAAPTAAEPEVAATGVAATVEQLRESLSELVDDPDVPISAEDVEEFLEQPNAPQLVADAAAELRAEVEAELAAELAAAESET